MEKQVGIGELLQSGAKATQKQKFLADMESIVPFKEWTALIEPYYCQERADRRGVEHAFHIIKNKFGWKRVRYRGGEKNDSLFRILFTSVNLLMLIRRGIKLKTA